MRRNSQPGARRGVRSRGIAVLAVLDSGPQPDGMSQFSTNPPAQQAAILGLGGAPLDAPPATAAPVNGLADPARVVNGPDLSYESQAPNLRYLDTFGHGTHMAGIIAGRDNGVRDNHSAKTGTSSAWRRART